MNVKAAVCLSMLVMVILLWSVWHPLVPHRLVNSSDEGGIHTVNSSTSRKPIPAWEYQRILGVGIDVDWMTFRKVNRYYFYWRSKGLNVPAYFRERGFSNVRIRVSGDVRFNRTVLVQLAEVVNDTLNAGLIPVITYTAPELRGNPTNPQSQEHFIKWWETVADYFKNYPYELSYDLLIESSGEIKTHPEVLNEVYREVIHYIRTVDPHRLVFVTPAGISSPFYLRYLNVTNDNYTLAEWHIYASGPKNCTYNQSYIEKAILVALNWSKETGIPTWVGAWRPNRYTKKGVAECPISTELEFSRFMASALCTAGIPYDVNADVHFFDMESLRWYKDENETLEVVLHPCG